MAGKKKDSLKYGEARDRLEEILREIEGNEVEVDELGERVKEAAKLIQLCRKKLEKTRAEVEKVVGEMKLEDKEAAEDADSADAPEEEDEEDGSSDAPF
ncbi:MAG: exodeoxyribonuclease VII small subunit [Planctomycetota bacterium]|jgi:exodeoxyribonuclease VII small subunit